MAVMDWCSRLVVCMVTIEYIRDCWRFDWGMVSGEGSNVGSVRGLMDGLDDGQVKGVQAWWRLGLWPTRVKVFNHGG
ncbi:hypothetical protein V6N13_094669 [Hibiscus sabdariffa]|uniref:Uncharacterized protein n=1 Tax=Hibiscus sabdariffa TaxID=183260 RepID=A0ABR2B943_9ROSI